MRTSHRALAVVSSFLLLFLVIGCDADQTLSGPASDADRMGTNMVVVTADEHQSFVTSADEIGPGWTTFVFDNQTHAPHFVVIERMPVFEGDQKTVEDSEAEVVPVFQNFMDSFRDEALTFPDAGFELPAWYGEVVFMGGPGLTSAGETAATRILLEPGTYVVECYVKTEDGTFHSTNGMIEGLVVTEDGNRADAPARTSGRVTVSSTAGITVEGDVLRPDVHTFEVHFADQAAYSHFLGHDVHLVRLGDGADLGELEAWMSWVVPGSLASPEPAGVDFLGGVQDMPGGSTAYVNVRLESGDYAWIAEVPDASGKGMLVEFNVP